VRARGRLEASEASPAPAAPRRPVSDARGARAAGAAVSARLHARGRAPPACRLLFDSGKSTSRRLPRGAGGVLARAPLCLLWPAALAIFMGGAIQFQEKN
jgi:hypothetical protein